MEQVHVQFELFGLRLSASILSWCVVPVDRLARSLSSFVKNLSAEEADAHPKAREAKQIVHLLTLFIYFDC